MLVQTGIADIVTELVSILVSGITSLGEGIGTGLSATVTAAFVTESNGSYSLTTFGGVIAAFGAIGLAVGLTTLVVKWVMSLGARN